MEWQGGFGFLAFQFHVLIRNVSSRPVAFSRYWLLRPVALVDSSGAYVTDLEDYGAPMTQDKIVSPTTADLVVLAPGETLDIPTSAFSLRKSHLHPGVFQAEAILLSPIANWKGWGAGKRVDGRDSEKFVNSLERHGLHAWRSARLVSPRVNVRLLPAVSSPAG